MGGEAKSKGGTGFGRGAALLSLGVGASGLLTYVYFALASHVLDTENYGALVVLWSVLFISVVTLYRPVEQFVSRSIAESTVTGADRREAIRIAATIQVLLAAAYVVVALIFRDQIEDGLLSGNSFLYEVLLLAAPAYAVSFFARGYLAGGGHFGLYGSMLLLESCSRVAVAFVSVIGLVHGLNALASGILLAPLMSLCVVPFVVFSGTRLLSRPRLDPIGEEPESPVGVGMTMAKGGTFVGSAFVVMLSEQALLNVGVLIVAAGLDAAAAGLLFNVMLIARAPQVLFGAVTTSLLPSLSRLWANRSEAGVAAFHRQTRNTLRALALFDLLVIVAVALAGPALMKLTFGGDHSYDREGLVIVALGMGFHLAALTLTQAQLARDRATGAAACWAASAVGFMLFTALSPFGAVRSAELGYALAAFALSVLLYMLYSELLGRRSPYSGTG